jgi:translation initiation factor IF-1
MLKIRDMRCHCERFFSVQETAKHWGISVRWVNQYALEGRIPGAERLGRTWAIPEDAVKPEKHRSGPKPKETPERSSRKVQQRST